MKQGNEFKELWEELLKLIEELKEKGVTDLDAILMQKMYYVRAVMKETLTNKGSVTVTVPGLRRYFIDINKDLINHPIELYGGGYPSIRFVRFCLSLTRMQNYS